MKKQFQKPTVHIMLLKGDVLTTSGEKPVDPTDEGIPGGQGVNPYGG